MKKICLLFLSGLVLTCSPKRSELVRHPKADVHIKSLEDSGTRLVIPVDRETPNQTRALSLITDRGNRLLAYLNVPKNEIQFYNLSSKELIKRIQLEKSGHDGVGEIHGFYALSPDSVFIISKQYSNLVLVNGLGKIIQSIDYSVDDKGHRIRPSKIQTASPFQGIEFIGGEIYLTDLATGNWSSMSQEELSQTDVCVVIDTVAKEVRKRKFTYPSDYWANGNKEPVFSRIFANGKFIYSFFGDQYIYVTTPSHEKVEKHYAGSRYFMETPPYPSKDLNMEEVLRYYTEISSFGSMVYDKYRNVYYRFAVLGGSHKEGTNLMKVMSSPPSSSIIILSENFEKLGEFRPKDRYYWTNNFFVAEEGLYLSTNHTNNPEMKEDSLSFALLKLK